MLSAEQLAERWDVKPSTICRRCKDGTIPAFRIGRTWRILIADIEAIEANGRP
ncbi:helix-turn-helix domain-containing protein [Mycobacterium interjectum]|uniref:helix-turn-helix domain-containing protein n=1 Tax=Mycobacterium interjectum TaxID=33895 RepID=UPI0013573C84|nr:helix-turn-helix domain-containing protein [Mycobacterium interjectum]MCV7089611.1 helix-turn-helix domain-containing protein [Mycobacterium interjectum]